MMMELRTEAEQAHALHFLLIEDDDDHAEIVQRTLLRDHPGNSITRVADGEAGLAYLRGSGPFTGASRADIVLLDLKLPGRDGHQILKEIKEDAALCAVPVVVLTTSGADCDRKQAYCSGANSYIVKPANFSRVRQMVSDLSTYWGCWSQPYRAG